MIMISYSSNERNNGTLGKVERELAQMGQNTWIDNPEDGACDSGIIPGELHRDSIAEAILRANLVLVINSDAWWASPYCRWEFEFAKRAGKRIVFLQISNDDGRKGAFQKAQDTSYPCISQLDELTDVAKVGSELAQAHAELLWLWYSYSREDPDTVQPANTDAMLKSQFWNAPVAKDDAVKCSKDDAVLSHAQIVFANRTQLENAGITPGVLSFAEMIVCARQKRKQIKHFLYAAIFCVIICLSVLALYFERLAIRDNRTADEAMLKQKSLLLAEQSRNQENSYRKWELAQQAERAASTDIAQNALMLAGIETAQIEEFRIPQGKYVGAALTPDAKFLAIGEQNNLYIANLSNGNIEKSISLDFKISARHIAISKDASYAAVVAPAGKLAVVDITKGTALHITDDAATAFSVDGRDRLWVAHNDGVVSVREFPWTGEPDAFMRTDAGMITSILALEKEESLALLLADGKMRLYNIDGRTLRLECAISMFSEELKTRSELGVSENTSYADALIQSGNNIAALRQGRVSLWERQKNHVTSASEAAPYINRFQESWILPASLGGPVITYQSALNLTEIYPENSFNPLSFLPVSAREGNHLLAGTVEGKVLAVIKPEGVVQILHIDNVPLQMEDPQGWIPVPSCRGLLTLHPDGKLYSSEGNVELDLESEVVLGTELFSGDYFFILCGNGELCAVNTNTLRVIRDALPISNACVYSGGNEKQLFLYNNKEYCVYHIENDTELILDLHGRNLTCLKASENIVAAAMNRDGSQVALSTSLGRILLLSAQDGALLYEGETVLTGYSGNILFNDAGHLLVLLAGGRIHLYDDKLTLCSMTVIGQPAIAMKAIAGSSLALVKLINGDFIIIHSERLLALQKFSVPEMERMSFSVVDLEEGVFWLNQVSEVQRPGAACSAKLYRFKLAEGVQESEPGLRND